MKKMAMIMLVLYGYLSITACGNSSNSSTIQTTPTPQPVGADIIQKYGFHTNGQPTSMSLTLPQQFTDADWGLKEAVCQQAGYDLTPYSGQSVTAIKYPLTETYSGDSLSLFILAKDQTCICGYIAATHLVPGIIAVNDPNIK